VNYQDALKNKSSSCQSLATPASRILQAQRSGMQMRWLYHYATNAVKRLASWAAAAATIPPRSFKIRQVH
jgi:hypothetical protein